MKKLVLILVMLLLSSCMLEVYTTPQPEGKSNMDEIPEKYWGVYKNDDGVIKLNKDSIIFKENKGFINDQQWKLNKDVLVRKYRGAYYLNVILRKDDFESEEDSILFSVADADEIYTVCKVSFENNHLILTTIDDIDANQMKIRNQWKCDEYTSVVMVYRSDSTKVDVEKVLYYHPKPKNLHEMFNDDSICEKNTYEKVK